MQIAAELGDGREALRRAARLRPDRLPPMLLERRTHFLIDVARGHVQQADDRAAVGTLIAADRTAPEEVRFNPAADLPAFIEHAQAAGWQVCVVATPSGMKFLEFNRLTEEFSTEDP